MPIIKLKLQKHMNSELLENLNKLKKMLVLLSEEKVYRKFAENAYEAAKEYDIRKVLPLYEEAYQEALER